MHLLFSSLNCTFALYCETVQDLPLQIGVYVLLRDEVNAETSWKKRYYISRKQLIIFTVSEYRKDSVRVSIREGEDIK